MRVELTTGLVRGGSVFIAGDVIDIPEIEAKAFIAKGVAEPVTPERSVNEEREKATLHRRKR